MAVGRDFKLVLDHTDHSPGSVVTGRLTVEVSKARRYHSIVVELTGVEESGDKKGSDSCLRLETVVWTVGDPPTGGDLPAGCHAFPFSFQLPQTLLPSSLRSGAHCWVKYLVTATVLQDRGSSGNRLRPRCVASADFDVTAEPSTDILRLYKQPKSLQKKRSLKFSCFGAGSVLAMLSVPRRGFSPGDTIPLCVHITNQSPRQVHVESVLRAAEMSVVGGRREGGVVADSVVARTTSVAIMPGEVTSYADRNLMVPSDVHARKKSSSSNVAYGVAIAVGIPWSADMVVKILVFVAGSAAKSASSATGQAVGHLSKPTVS